MNRTPLVPTSYTHRGDPRPSLFGALEFDFGDAPPPVPFAEPIRGLHVREIDGSEVFCHFFGRAGASH